MHAKVATASTTHGKASTSRREQPSDKSRRGNVLRSHCCRPSEADVVRALKSLYQDQLKPSSRTLRRRIGELAAVGASDIAALYAVPGGDSRKLPSVDLAMLWAACERCSAIVLQCEKDGDWTALLADARTTTFIDVYDPVDPFPAHVWNSAAAYFASLSSDDMLLPGGRYACAQALVARKLGFLANFTPGQVCHMVEISMTHRKLLGYYNNSIVPYAHSFSMKKDRCALQQRPCVAENGSIAESSSSMPPASLHIARRYLSEILRESSSHGDGTGMLPLSNIKRLFRLRYKTELSETYFGHSRLSDLLQDERFCDLCTLRLQKNGYIIVPREPLFGIAKNVDTAVNMPSWSKNLHPFCRSSAAVISLEDSLQFGLGHQARCASGKKLLCTSEHESTSGSSDAEQVASELPVIHFCPDEPLCLEDVAHIKEVSSSPTGALPTPLPSPGVPPSATIRKWSFCFEASPGDPSYVVTDAQRREGLSPIRPSSSAPCRVELSDSEHRCVDDDASEVPHCSAPLSSPTPLPSPGLPAEAMIPSWMQGPCRIEFCKDEPLRLEDGGWSPWRSTRTPLASPGVPGSATILKWAGLARKHDSCQDQPCNQESAGGQLLAEAALPAFEWPTQWQSLASLKTSCSGGKLMGSKKASPLAHKGMTALPPTHPQTPTIDESRGSFSMQTPRVELPGIRKRTRQVPEPLTAEAMYSPAVEGWAAAGLVHNTFIHARPLLPTPVARGRRSQSLPKDVMLGQSNAESFPNSPQTTRPSSAEDDEQLESKDSPNLNFVVSQSSRSEALQKQGTARGCLHREGSDLVSCKPHLQPGTREFEVLATRERHLCPFAAGSDIQASPTSAMLGECRSQSVPPSMRLGASLLSGEMDGLNMQPRTTRRSSTSRLGAHRWCRAVGA